MDQTAKAMARPFRDVRPEGAALYQIAAEKMHQMMGYLIRTRSGKLFCIDGGWEEDADLVLDLARAVKGLGPNDPIHFDGWFLGVVVDVAKHHLHEVTIDHLWYRFPSEAYVASCPKNDTGAHEQFKAVQERLAPFSEPLYAGMSLDFGYVRFDVLTEPDDTITEYTINNTSAAIRVTIEGQTILFLADMGKQQGERLLEAYRPEELRSDFVQMAHHGQWGVDYSVYDTVAPKVCLWPTPKYIWINQGAVWGTPEQNPVWGTKPGYGNGPFEILKWRCYMWDMGVKHHFVQKDGTWEIPLPFDFNQRGNGPMN